MTDPQLGSDVLLDDDGADLRTSAADDLLPITGADVVRQDLAEALRTPLGSLPWDPGAGSTLVQMLSGVTAAPGAVEGELRRVALRDPRIDAASIAIQPPPAIDQPWRMSFTVLGSTDTIDLSFDPQSLANV